MDLLLILTYTAICVAIFKIFRIPLNKWTVPTAVLGGVLIIGTLIMLMNYNHPYSEMARNYYISTPIVPLVKGRVVEVPVKPNQQVKQGDVLFRIDDTPFKQQVASLQARLQSNQSPSSISSGPWSTTCRPSWRKPAMTSSRRWCLPPPTASCCNWRCVRA